MAHAYETNNFDFKLFKKSAAWKGSKTKVADLIEEIGDNFNFNQVTLEVIEPKNGKYWVKATFFSQSAKFNFIKIVKELGSGYITIPLPPRELKDFEEMNRKKAMAEITRFLLSKGFRINESDLIVMVGWNVRDGFRYVWRIIIKSLSYRTQYDTKYPIKDALKKHSYLPPPPPPSRQI